MMRVVRTQKALLSCLFIFTCCSIYFFLADKNSTGVICNFKLAKRLSQERINSSMRKNKGIGCIMPKLLVHTDETTKIHNVDDIACNHIVDWVKCYKAECSLSEYAMKLNHVVCKYQEILLDDNSFPLSDPVTVVGSGVFKFNQSDYVKVSCQADSENILSLPLRWVGFKAGLRPIAKKVWKAGDAPSIMILALDSTSRNGFIRRLPEVYDYVVKELGALEFQSYNIVGDGTSAALFPLFTGKNDYDFDYAARVADGKITQLNTKDFIFHTMNEIGYETLFFEDMPWIGAFQRKYYGFAKTPTDRYNRPFVMVESSGGAKWWSGKKRRYCVGDTPHHVLTLNLTAQFLESNRKHFGFSILADVSHEDFNLISAIKNDLLAYLEDYKNTKMDDTLLILMGDHGARYTTDPFRTTIQGRIEERLPLLMMVPPLSFRKKRPDGMENLKQNQYLLTTPFDLHATLLDLVGLKWKANPYKVPGSKYPRSLSLLDPLPRSRSCPEAGIEPHWCACVRWKRVFNSGGKVERTGRWLAHSIVKKINELTAPYRSLCVGQVLQFITNAFIQVPNEELINYISSEDGVLKHSKTSTTSEYYQIQIVLLPGSATYEATVHLGEKINYREISRLDAYGNTSQCISQVAPKLEKFCYCRNNSNVISEATEMLVAYTI